MRLRTGLAGEVFTTARASGSLRRTADSAFARFHHADAPGQHDGQTGWRVGGAMRHRMLAALEMMESKRPESVIAGFDLTIRELISAKKEIDNAVRTALIRDFVELLFRLAENNNPDIACKAVERLTGLETFARETQGVELGTSGALAGYIDLLLLYDLHPERTTEDIKRYFAELGGEKESRQEQVRTVAITRLMAVAAKIVASEVKNPWTYRHILKALRGMGADAFGILPSPPEFEAYYTKEDEPGWREAEPKIRKRRAELEAQRAWRKKQAAEGLNELILERCESLREKLAPDMDQLIAIVGSRHVPGMH